MAVEACCDGSMSREHLTSEDGRELDLQTPLVGALGREGGCDFVFEIHDSPCHPVGCLQQSRKAKLDGKDRGRMSWPPSLENRIDCAHPIRPWPKLISAIERPITMTS